MIQETPVVPVSMEQPAMPMPPPRSLWDRVAGPWRMYIEPPMVRWLTWWHGRGTPEQFPYYRCHGCRRIVTWVAIKRGGCTCGLSNKLSPAALRWWEKLQLICVPFWGCVR